MSFPQGRGNGGSYAADRLEFIETARYNMPESSASGYSSSRYTEVPPPWTQHRHPNGDIYYYNHQLRLISPDNIRDPTILNYVLEAREDHLGYLEEDRNFNRLPRDWEMIVSDVSDDTAVIGMYSRMAGVCYEWTEERGLVIKPKEHFWSHVAEFPSHHATLPPNTEAEFIRALQSAKTAIASGAVLPFSSRQIDQIIGRYQYLKSIQASERNATPALAWLMGAVMPLDTVGRTIEDGDLEALMGELHF